MSDDSVTMTELNVPVGDVSGTVPVETPTPPVPPDRAALEFVIAEAICDGGDHFKCQAQAEAAAGAALTWMEQRNG